MCSAVLFCFVLNYWWWRWNVKRVQPDHEISISLGYLRRKSHLNCAPIVVLKVTEAFKITEACDIFQTSIVQLLHRIEVFFHFFLLACYSSCSTNLNPYVSKWRLLNNFHVIEGNQVCRKLFHVKIA